MLRQQRKFEDTTTATLQRIEGTVNRLWDHITPAGPQRSVRHDCAKIARGTASYWRELAETQVGDEHMAISRQCALARAETADQIAKEIEDY